MSEGQKVIKYLAIAFAIFLSVNIIIGIISAIFFAFSIFGVNLGIVEIRDNISNDTTEQIQFSKTYENIENINIEVGYSKLEIKQGTQLRVEAKSVNNTFSVKKISDTLNIKDNQDWNIFNSDISSEIIITIPENTLFEKVKVEAGSGEVKLSNLQTKNFDFEVGAGNVTISNINVEKKTSIDGGAGKVIVQDSSLNNLDLDVGVGEFNLLNTRLLDNTDIDAGVGKLEISLKGSLEDYKIVPKKGLGSFTIQNSEIEDDKTYGEGDNRIKIDAGIGKVSINFEK